MEQKSGWNHNKKLWEQEIKDGETLADSYCMKTDILEKLIVLGHTVLGDFKKAMTQNESFRCEMFYDAKAQVVDYAFFTKPEGYANYTRPECEE